MNPFAQHVMARIRFCGVLMILVAFLALPACADLYSWTDANGVKHFSNDPPPDGREAVQSTEVKHSSDRYQKLEEQRQSRQDKVLEDGRSDDAESKPKVSHGRRATGQSRNVVIYTTPKCGYCARAKAFFSKNGIAYTEYDITTDKKAHERFSNLKGTGVPLIFVGDKRVQGFNEGLLRRLLAIK
jgi:glutaredoxin